ncbi:DEAD/DEAH box helicase [Intestinibacillus massiliensis]|nr:DEAD/DEAH box helicase [Intestinibacillus massiliensis]
MVLRDYQSALLNATLDSFRKGNRRVLAVLPCGAGKTACFAKAAADLQQAGHQVWFAVHRRELIEQTVATFDRFGIPRKKIDIGMISAFANHADKFHKPEFIVLDEAHHASAATWKRVLDLYPQALVLGLTATPARLSGAPLGEVFDDLVAGVTASELIHTGYLAPYRYFAPQVADLSTLSRKGADYDRSEAAELLSQRAVFGDVIAHWKKYAENMQTICYCSTVSHSQHVAAAFREAGIPAIHFDGGTTAQERAEAIAAFRAGQVKVLCNVDLISEGFDVPDCGCCILLRPTLSTTLFIQQSMRCMRPSKGKTAIILDHVNNYERHGLPDDVRSWSLAQRMPKRSSYQENGLLRVRQCPKCFMTYAGDLKKCPYCGETAHLTQQEIKNLKDIELAEIKVQKIAGRETIYDCESIQELYAWCKAHGKKPGFAYHVAREKGWLC